MNMKKITALLLAVVLVLCLIPAGTASAAYQLNASMLTGSTWYGEFNSYYQKSGKPYTQARTLSISSCDENGYYNAEQYCYDMGDPTVYARYAVTGRVNFSAGTITMKAERILEQKGNWGYGSTTTGTIDENGIHGSYLHNTVNKEVTFYLARTSDWALDEVTEANITGLIPETVAGKDLTQVITRGEFAAVCVRLYESLTGQEVAPYTGGQFNDIAGNENENYIRRAYAVNIAVGIAEHTFAPDKTLSRQEMATMLTRVIKKYKYPYWTWATDGQYALDISGVQPFSDDALIGDWARPSVYYLYKMGIIRGMTETPPTFAPYNATAEQEAANYATSTREQAVLLSLRVFKQADQF